MIYYIGKQILSYCSAKLFGSQSKIITRIFHTSNSYFHKDSLQNLKDYLMKSLTLGPVCFFILLFLFFFNSVMLLKFVSCIRIFSQFWQYSKCESRKILKNPFMLQQCLLLLFPNFVMLPPWRLSTRRFSHSWLQKLIKIPSYPGYLA